MGAVQYSTGPGFTHQSSTRQTPELYCTLHCILWYSCTHCIRVLLANEAWPFWLPQHCYSCPYPSRTLAALVCTSLQQWLKVLSPFCLSLHLTGCVSGFTSHLASPCTHRRSQPCSAGGSSPSPPISTHRHPSHPSYPVRSHRIPSHKSTHDAVLALDLLFVHAPDAGHGPRLRPSDRQACR